MASARNVVIPDIGRSGIFFTSLRVREVSDYLSFLFALISMLLKIQYFEEIIYNYIQYFEEIIYNYIYAFI